MADIVKALVLAWSAALLTASYLGIFPQMKMDNTFVASLADWCDGFVWHRTKVQWKWKQEAYYCR